MTDFTAVSYRICQEFFEKDEARDPEFLSLEDKEDVLAYVGCVEEILREEFAED